MAVVPMQKVSLLVHHGDKPKVLAFLQEKGVLQVTDVEESMEGLTKMELDDESHELEFRVAELDFAVQFLSKFEAKKKGLQAMVDGDTFKIGYEKLKEVAESYQYPDMVERCRTMEEEMVSLRNEIKSIHVIQEKLGPWKHLRFSLSGGYESASSMLMFVAVPFKEWNSFKEEVSKLSELVALGKESRFEDKMFVQIVVDKSVFNDVNATLSTYKAELIEMPLFDSSVEDELKRLVSRLEQINVRQGQLDKVAKDFSKELKELRTAYDYYNWRLQQKMARKHFAATESTVLIEGWMPKESMDTLRKDLEKTTQRFVLEETEPKEDEDAPVLLMNKGVMKPFQEVTGIYGLPLPNELDPTPYLAVFFIAFYGLALTDAVYGLLMFAIMFVVLRYLRIPKESQGMLKLLMYAGISTFILGTLFGGWASLAPEQVPAWLTTVNDAGETVFIGQKISAIKNPLNVLILSLALGFIQVLVGVYMNFIWKFKRGSKKDALIDQFPWVYLLTIIGFAILVAAKVLPESLGGIVNILLYIGLAGIVLTQGRDKKNIVLKFLSGVLGLYGLVGYLSDVLSYSRLLALGLATSIIGLAVNTIAGMVNGIPFIGIILALIVLVVGHIFNIGINALGAFIHSGRLQFVEFFTKFMEGGGQAFQPLKRDSKYVRLKD